MYTYTAGSTDSGCGDELYAPCYSYGRECVLLYTVNTTYCTHFCDSVDTAATVTASQSSTGVSRQGTTAVKTGGREL